MFIINIYLEEGKKKQHNIIMRYKSGIQDQTQFYNITYFRVTLVYLLDIVTVTKNS